MMFGVDYERSGEDELVARWDGDDGDGTGRLTVTARSNDFGGSGQAWFNRQTVLEFAQALGRFPLAEEEPAAISGGYGEPSEYDEHVGIVVGPLGSLGQVDVRLHLVQDTWSPHGRVDGRYETRMHLLTTYQRLSAFSRDLEAVVEGTLSEAILGGESLA